MISVELKLSDWKKALVQAQNYQLGSDYVYVAFPDTKRTLIQKKVEPLLIKKGIGLLFYDVETKQVNESIRPALSRRKLGTITLKEIQRRQRKKRKTPHMF